MGSPEFAVPVLRALQADFRVIGVFTQPDKPKGRGREATPTPVKTTALSLGIPVLEPHKLTSEDTMAALERWRPDVIVVVAFGKILPQSILGYPRLGCVNLHASLLPRHRGASPIPHAILEGDEVTGLTTILMDRGMDTGDILLTHVIPISEDDTAGSLHDKMLEPGARLVVETLKGLAHKTVELKPQDHDAATYTKLLAKEDGRVDWTREAGYLSRLVRAMNPWPVAFFTHAGESVRIWVASAIPGRGDPGAVVSTNDDGIAVGTGKDLLLLTEVQAPGKRRVSAAEFSHGRRLAVGDVLVA